MEGEVRVWTMKQQELNVAASHIAGNVIVVEAVYVFQIPTQSFLLACLNLLRSTILPGTSRRSARHIHGSVPRPLHFFDDVKARMHDELVHVPSILSESSDAICALLRSAKLVLKQRVVLSTNNAKVVGHLSFYQCCCVPELARGCSRSPRPSCMTRGSGDHSTRPENENLNAYQCSTTYRDTTFLLTRLDYLA